MLTMVHGTNHATRGLVILYGDPDTSSPPPPSRTLRSQTPNNFHKLAGIGIFKYKQPKRKIHIIFETM